MFRLVEALNDHLIGPKTWDLSVRKYGTHFGQSVNGYGLLGALCNKLCNNSCVDVCEAGNDRETWVY